MSDQGEDEVTAVFESPKKLRKVSLDRLLKATVSAKSGERSTSTVGEIYQRAFYRSPPHRIRHRANDDEESNEGSAIPIENGS